MSKLYLAKAIDSHKGEPVYKLNIPKKYIDKIQDKYKLTVCDHDQKDDKTTDYNILDLYGAMSDSLTGDVILYVIDKVYWKLYDQLSYEGVFYKYNHDDRNIGDQIYKEFIFINSCPLKGTDGDVHTLAGILLNTEQGVYWDFANKELTIHAHCCDIIYGIKDKKKFNIEFSKLKLLKHK